MLRATSLLRASLVASVSICVSSCATVERTRLSYPSAEIFEQEQRPVATIDILLNDDAEAYRRWQRDKDDWGRRGWDRVWLLCRWFADQGVSNLPCTDADRPVQVP